MAELGVILISMIFVLVSARDLSLQDCDTKLSVLETALYETGNNPLQLNRIFFPPHRAKSRFIRIIYSFQNEAGELDGCDVSYIWAVGGFLLMQPPTIFQFTSLFFNYPNNDLKELHLQLPYECRPLISSSCSCFGNETDLMLNIVTQQLTTYARADTPEAVVRENNYARAVCASELQKRFYSNKESTIVYTLICLTILFPFFVIILCSLAYKKAGDVVHLLTKRSKHEMTVAMSLIGVYISLTIYIMDIFACRNAITANHEYRDDIDSSSINVTLTIGTLICDTIFLLPLIFGLSYALYICCMEMCGKEDKFNLPYKILSVCKVMKREDTANGNDDDNYMFIFLCMLVSPLLCFSSHVGFILMSWLTEPSKSTTVFILYYFVFVYLFLVFRECYRFYSGIHFSCTRKKVVATEIEINDNAMEMGELPQGQGTSLRTTSTTKHVSPRNEDYINVQAFCLILLVHSIFIVGIPIMIALAFILVPLETAELVTYIFQLFQLLVVLVSTVFIYQLFSSQKFSIDRFLKVFHKNIDKGNESTDSEGKGTSEKPNDTEKAGEIVAQLTNTIFKLGVKAPADQ